MVQTVHDSRTSWLYKACESALAATALLNLLLFPLQLLPLAFFEKYGQYFKYVLIGSIGVALLSSLIFSWIWHRREQANIFNSIRHHAWLQAIIRYWLALSISTYGFAKILKTQFQTPDFFLDMTLSAVNGMGLTWYYFGYSYPLAVTIGLFQIGGSILILYRRTTLLGVMILLPVMINIVLINLFFNIAVGALFNSVIYSLSLIFLLLLHWKKLKTVFWDLVDHLPGIPPVRGWMKHSLRLLVIAAAFVSLKVEMRIRPNEQTLKGTWKVEKLIRNGQVQPATAWLTDNRAWSRIYFAGNEGCAFSPNPYRISSGESLFGGYEFDSLHNKLQVNFYTDTLRATLSHRTAETMQLQGVLGHDTLDIQLARLHR